jgi:hypothetical protein
MNNLRRGGEAGKYLCFIKAFLGALINAQSGAIIFVISSSFCFSPGELNLTCKSGRFAEVGKFNASGLLCSRCV